LNRRKKLVLVFGSAGGVLALIAMVVFFEPFAPRYQGHTVNQWLDVFAAKEGGWAEAHVVNGFGTNALPTLMQATKGPFWMNSQFVQGLDQSNKNDFIRRNIHKTFARARRRTKLAYDWAFKSIGIGKDKQFLQNLLSDNPDDQFVLRMFRYLQNTYTILPMDIFEYHAKDPDARVRDRVRRLFKDYKNWDDKTYEKWLSELDRPNSPFSVGHMLPFDQSKKLQ
jgi:hypothetical protein